MKKRFSHLLAAVATLAMLMAVAPPAVLADELPETDVMFTFDEDAEGFYVPFFMETQVTSAHEDGAIKLTMTTDARPPIIQRPLDPTIDGSQYKWLYIKLKNEGMGAAAMLSFSSLSKGLGENLGIDDPSHKIVFAVSKQDTEFKEYWVELSGNEKWIGYNDIDMLRVTIGADWASPNYSVYVDTIALYAEKPETPTEPEPSDPTDPEPSDPTDPTDQTDPTDPSGEESSAPAENSQTPSTRRTTADGDGSVPADTDEGGSNVLPIVLIVIGGVVILAGAGVGAWFILKKRGKTPEQ